MNPKEIFKNIIQGYANKLKLYAMLIGGGVLGGIVLICCLGAAIAGGDESMDGSDTPSGTVNSSQMSNANPLGSGAGAATQQGWIELRLWEGGGTIYQNAEGIDCYKVQSDGSATGLAVGYGVDIGTHGAELRNRGYDTSKGALIPVSVVDEIEERELQSNLTVLQNTLAANNIELKPYQVDALLSRSYNCGLAGALTYRRGSENLTFAEYYKKYWNQERDSKFGQEVDYSHKLYTEYMDVPVTDKDGQFLQGLENRRKAEWKLFQTGYYERSKKQASTHQIGDRIQVNITGETGGVFNEGSPGYVKDENGVKQPGWYKFHSNITGLDHWGVYAQDHFYYTNGNGERVNWHRDCNIGAEFIILSGYISDPEPLKNDSFISSLKGQWYNEVDQERYNNYGLEIVKHQNNTNKPENGNNLMYKYVAEVQDALPKGGYVVLYIRNTEVDTEPNKDLRKGAVTPNVIGNRWTREFHFVSIIGYDIKDGKEYMFVAETANQCVGWYPIEEFENLTRGYITKIVTIMPK